MVQDEEADSRARFPAIFADKTRGPDWYLELLDAVVGQVQVGSQRAIVAANQELVATYWGVGNEILARQGAEGWSARVIDRLASDLKERLSDDKGLSPRSAKYMRTVAGAWPAWPIMQRGVARLAWRIAIACQSRPAMRVFDPWDSSVVQAGLAQLTNSGKYPHRPASIPGSGAFARSLTPHIVSVRETVYVVSMMGPELRRRCAPKP